MKTLLIFTLFLISGGGESERVMGYSGGGVLIKCRYDTGYTSNQKYLCKGPWSNCADQIKTEVKNEWINSGRFSLFDDTRAAQFWVVIRELTVKDSGMYNCAVDKDLAIDVYKRVELKVEEDLSYKKSISVTGHVGGSVNISCKYSQSHSSYPKFLCRRVGTADCNNTTSVKESRRWRNEGKLSLHDDGKQIFTVIINNLTEGDSGEYWCGAESDWTSDHGYKAYITQINLTVTERRAMTASTSPSSSTPQSTETTSSTAPTTTVNSSFKTSTAYSSMVIVVILALLLMGLLFFIVTLKKRSKTRDPGRNQSQPLREFSVHRVSQALYDYEEIDITHLPSSDNRASTVYSPAQLPTNPSEPSQVVYVTIKLS
ncbi:CMRF35-like molecule 8 [Pygocentrus nattereri]|uniref:CMRF35-like molecule 8 n=1 Tax=Pygocentrus nattereri TaxID=42514 RepID=UPI001890FF45|nr:CMRF35-like molecule 8 [Pygocentrus nattereri]